MNEKEKDALIQVKHFNNITRYWQEEEYEEKEIKKYITTILNLIEKQDKIINEMAYCIDNYQICEYEIQDYNDRKCEYIADDETPPCKECIIEYFTKKVGG